MSTQNVCSNITIQRKSTCRASWRTYVIQYLEINMGYLPTIILFKIKRPSIITGLLFHTNFKCTPLSEKFSSKNLHSRTRFQGPSTTLPSTRLTGVHTGPRIGRTDTKPTEWLNRASTAWRGGETRCAPVYCRDPKCQQQSHTSDHSGVNPSAKTERRLGYGPRGPRTIRCRARARAIDRPSAFPLSKPTGHAIWPFPCTGPIVATVTRPRTNRKQYRSVRSVRRISTYDRGIYNPTIFGDGGRTLGIRLRS